MSSNAKALTVVAVQIQKPKWAKVFNKNFFKDFRALLGPDHIIQQFSKCDFEVSPHSYR